MVSCKSSVILVIRGMHFILQKMLSSVPTARLSTDSLTSLPSSLSHPSGKQFSTQEEWLPQSWHAPSSKSETPQWPLTLRPVPIPCNSLHIADQSPLHHMFSLCQSPIFIKHSGIVASSDHTSEWDHWVCTCIGIVTRWVMLHKSLLMFLLPGCTMQFSLY